jgi:hypothetical protein
MNGAFSRLMAVDGLLTLSDNMLRVCGIYVRVSLQRKIGKIMISWQDEISAN